MYGVVGTRDAVLLNPLPGQPRHYIGLIVVGDSRARNDLPGPDAVPSPPFAGHGAHALQRNMGYTSTAATKRAGKRAPPFSPRDVPGSIHNVTLGLPLGDAAA